jgi:hypothetical protein
VREAVSQQRIAVPRLEAGARQAFVSILEQLQAGELQAGMLQAGMLQAGMLQAGMLQAGMLQAGMLHAARSPRRIGAPESWDRRAVNGGINGGINGGFDAAVNAAVNGGARLTGGGRETQLGWQRPTILKVAANMLDSVLNLAGDGIVGCSSTDDTTSGTTIGWQPRPGFA